MCVCVYVRATVRIWRSEDPVWESVLSFLVGPEHWTQVVTPGNKHSYLLAPLLVPICIFNIYFAF